MGILRDVFITETRVYDDPKAPDTSNYNVALPITVPDAVVDPATGETLTATLEEVGQRIAAAQTAADTAQDAADAALEALENLTQTVEIVPTQNGVLTYTGSVQSPSWNSFDSASLTLDGVTTGTDAGTYTATFTPKAGYKWKDGTTTAKSATWAINRANITTTPSQSGSLTYTGGVQAPVWNSYDSDKLTLAGATTGTNAGTYTATFTPQSNYQWTDSSTVARSANWSIGKAAGSLTLNKTSMIVNDDMPSNTIIVTRAGDGAVSASSSNTNIATVSVSGTTVTVTGRAKGGATITIYVAAGTNHNAPASATCSVTADFLPTKRAFNDMSWTDINTICQAGKAANYWSRGDTKTVPLTTGETITVRIEDFDHDTLTAGGMAKMTLGMVHCLNDKQKMNSTNTNVSGWGSSSMRSFMATLLSQLPSDLQVVIKQVKKTTSAGNKSTSLTTTDDKVWLFSATEVGQSSYNVAGEGTQYPLFISDASRVKNVNGPAGGWWLRSPFATSNTNFCSVSNSGSANVNAASYLDGVAAGFCI